MTKYRAIYFVDEENLNYYLFRICLDLKAGRNNGWQKSTLIEIGEEKYDVVKKSHWKQNEELKKEIGVIEFRIVTLRKCTRQGIKQSQTNKKAPDRV